MMRGGGGRRVGGEWAESERKVGGEWAESVTQMFHNVLQNQTNSKTANNKIQ